MGKAEEPGGGDTIDPRLLELLICPACGGDIQAGPTPGLACAGCRRVYPVRDGIPVMLVEAARVPGEEGPAG